jgi:hypothetical protein
LLPEPVVEKPARKPRTKKVVEEVIEEVEPVVELPKAPVVITQEVIYVEVIVYPPEGGVLNVKTESLYELHDISRFVLSKFKMRNLKFNCNVITNYQTLTSKIDIFVDDSADELLSQLKKIFDKLAYLNWKNFDERQGDIDRIKLNEEIIEDAFKPEPKPVELEKPKPVKVEKPKPVKVEKPAPVKVEKPKPIEKPKPVKVEKPKPVKVTKPKVTKPKAEDDLSFLDDLDNIF